MRWDTGPKWEHDDERTKHGFLFWPRTLINPKTGNEETRWLEWATIKQVYSCNYAGGGWDSMEWVNE